MPLRIRHRLTNASGRSRKRRGVAAVEFACVAPVFLILVIGMVEYGRMIMVQQMMTNAAREGARLAVMDGSTETGVKSTVQTAMAAGSITVSANDVAVSPDPASATLGSPITVTLEVPFTNVTWIPGSVLSGKTLTAECVMRKEAMQ